MSLAEFATINGTSATFRRRTPGAYTVKTGLQANTDADQTVLLVQHEFGAEEVGEGIDAEDRRYLLPASGITGGTPESEDLVIIGSTTYEIVHVALVEKRGAADHYDLQLRRV